MLDGEKKVIEDAVKGESSAFGLLYDHYHPKIYRFVMVKVSRREEAEDLTHQVFLHAWQNIKTYRHQGFPFGSWLYRIARNQVIDHYRTKRSNLAFEEIDYDIPASDSNANERVEQNITLDAVRTAIATLKPEYQDVIMMRFVEDMSLKETAAAMQKSEGAVKLLQHRALKQLQAILVGRAEEPEATL